MAARKPGLQMKRKPLRQHIMKKGPEGKIRWEIPEKDRLKQGTFSLVLQA
jgi:hypothetical protein